VNTVPSYFAFTPAPVFPTQVFSGTLGADGVTNLDGISGGNAQNLTDAKAVGLRFLFLENPQNSATTPFAAGSFRFRRFPPQRQRADRFLDGRSLFPMDLRLAAIPLRQTTKHSKLTTVSPRTPPTVVFGGSGCADGPGGIPGAITGWNLR
jgi:hypothetical protein